MEKYQCNMELQSNVKCVYNEVIFWARTSLFRNPLKITHSILNNFLKKHPKKIALCFRNLALCTFSRLSFFLSFSFQIQREIAVVPRMRTASHIWENFRLMDWSLSSNDMKDISGLNKDNRLYLPLIEGRPWCSDHPHYPFETPSI